MRCTKCHYLSFEPEGRCRNCGHDLSMDAGGEFDLAEATLDGLGAPEPVDASLLDAGAVLDDALGDELIAPPARPARPARSARPAPPAPAQPAPVTTEFPLFARAMQQPAPIEDDLEPLIAVPTRVRPPVAVRRPAPDSARLRATIDSPAAVERDLLDELAAADGPLASGPAGPLWMSVPATEGLPEAWMEKVGGGTRFVAAMIDAALLGTIVMGVLFFTLRLVGLPFSDVGRLPMAPLATLFLLLASTYLLIFTAACGQTVGKMAMHIRVVGTSSDAVINDRVTAGQAAVRSLATLPSVLALGVGFVPALVGEGLAVHDRVARTRVVRS